MESALVREKGRNSVSSAQDSFPKTILNKLICLRHIHISGDDHNSDAFVLPPAAKFFVPRTSPRRVVYLDYTFSLPNTSSI